MKGKKKKLTLIDRAHIQGIFQALMTYGQKDMIMPRKMRELFDHVIELWDEKMPPPKESNEADKPKF